MHSSPKYTTMIHAQLFQNPFNNNLVHFLQMILSVFFRIFPFIENPHMAGYTLMSGKNVCLTSTLYNMPNIRVKGTWNKSNTKLSEVRVKSLVDFNE